VPAILRMNYGDALEAPEFRPEEDTAAQAQANAERDEILLQAGVALPRQWFYARHDIPLPQEGEEVVGGAQRDPATDGHR